MLAARGAASRRTLATVPQRTTDGPAESLLHEAHRLGVHELPGLVARHASAHGCSDAVVYLADLRQSVLVPFLPAGGDGPSGAETRLWIDSTLAGSAFVQQQVQAEPVGSSPGLIRVWVPLTSAGERYGVLAATVLGGPAPRDREVAADPMLQRFAAAVTDLLRTGCLDDDAVCRLRRTEPMSLSAELQWSLLPALTYTDDAVTVAGGLEPAYALAGDSLDFAVDADCARFAVFDAMGNDLVSAQVVALAVCAYRNARRLGLDLSETARLVNRAVTAAHRGEAFATGVLGELDKRTGRLRWLSAGHPEPMVLGAGRPRRMRGPTPSLPFGLGRMLPADTPQHTTWSATVNVESLHPGEVLVLFSDGVTEARPSGGEFFGSRRLADAVARYRDDGLSAPETVRRVMRSLDHFQHGVFRDDATLLLVEWHASGPQSTAQQPE